MVFVFLLLAALYESVTLPFAVILIVPMCLLAAMLGVNMRGLDNNILTQIGLVVLIGLAAKNAILIVEFARQGELEHGLERHEAAAEAARTRLRPILMTSLAFILGVAPLAFAAGAGAEMRQALGVAVFFGMIGVTAFGLLFTPVFYVVFQRGVGAAAESADTAHKVGRLRETHPRRESAMKDVRFFLPRPWGGTDGKPSRVGKYYRSNPERFLGFSCRTSHPDDGCSVWPSPRRGGGICTSAQLAGYLADAERVRRRSPVCGAENPGGRARRVRLDRPRRADQPAAAAALVAALSGPGARPPGPAGPDAKIQNLKVAAANLAYAQALLDEARAGRYPSTSVTAGPQYGRSSTSLLTGAPAAWAYTAGFTASYQVDLFGRIRRTIEQASANVEATRAAEDVARVTVAAATAGAYANICGLGEQLDVANRSLAVVQQTYDITVRQRDAGGLSDFDVARQGVLLEQARAAIAPLDGQRRSALFQLAALTGKTPAEVRPPMPAAVAIPPRLDPPLPVGDGAALLRRRPDIRQAERTIAAETAGIGVATANLFPTVTLGGSVASSAGQLGQMFASSNVPPRPTASAR